MSEKKSGKRQKRVYQIRGDNQVKKDKTNYDKSDNDQFSIQANETIIEEDSDSLVMLTNKIFPWVETWKIKR